jgi:hypothetical protein
MKIKKKCTSIFDDLGPIRRLSDAVGLPLGLRCRVDVDCVVSVLEEPAASSFKIEE